MIIDARNTANTMDNIRRKLSADIGDTFQQLSKLLSGFGPETLNKVPFEGSWTAGQVAEHIIICGSAIPDSKTTAAERAFDEKEASVAELFLNPGIKFEADPLLQPKQATHNREYLLQMLQKIAARHKTTAETADLQALCLDMELPGFGHLTRYEWLRFVLVHTQRHTRQIEKIADWLSQ